MRRVALAAALSLVAGAALAQGTVQQSGPVVPFHGGVWFGNGVVADGGTPTTPYQQDLGLFGGANCPFGISSQTGPGVNTAPGGQFTICQTATTTTLIVAGVNGQPTPAVNFNIGGVIYPFPGPGNGDVLGPPSSILNGPACFFSTSGTLIANCPNITNAQISTTNLAVTSFLTSGGNAPGDGGLAYWVQGSGCPAAGRIASLNGQCYVVQSGPSVSILAFGAKMDGTSDDEPAWAGAAAYLNSVNGGTLTVPVGKSVINTSHCVAGISPLLFPNNVTIQGQGYGASTLATTGTGQCSQLLTFINPNDDWVRGLTLASTQASVTQGIPGLILFEEAANAPGPRYQNFGADDVYLGETSDNYKASVIDLGAYPMESASFTHMRCVFVSGDDQNPASVSEPSDCIEAYGEYNNAAGTIRNFIVSDSYGDGTWGKRFCTIWSGVVDAHCDRNYLLNFGAQTSPNTNTGAYALISYDLSADVSGPGQPPQDVWFVDNTIVNPYSNGSYCELTVNCHAVHNDISGQSDQGDATLPKSGISFAGSTGEIDHNILTNNYRDIVVIPQGFFSSSGGTVMIDHNSGTGNVANAQGIVVRGNGSGAFATDMTILDDNSDIQTGTGSVGTYWWGGGSASQIGNIVLTGGHYRGTLIDLRTFDTTTNHGVLATSLYIGGGVLLDGAPSTSVINLETTATPAIIDGVIMDFTSVPTSSAGGYFLAETALTINNLTIRNATTSGQSPLTLTSARGSMRIGALQFQNVTVSPRFVSTDFGFVSPSGSWSADSGTVIAAINPSAGVQGWQNVGGSTAWFPLGSFGTGGALVSATAPTVTSGLGTSPVVLANGTAAFQITVGGTGSPTTTEVLAMPTAAHGYACSVRDVTTVADTAIQTGSGTASVTFTWNNAPAFSDVLIHNCTQF